MPGSVVEDVDSYWATVEHAAENNPHEVLYQLLRFHGYVEVVRGLVLKHGAAAGQRALEEWQEQDMRAAEAQRARQEVGA